MPLLACYFQIGSEFIIFRGWQSVLTMEKTYVMILLSVFHRGNNSYMWVWKNIKLFLLSYFFNIMQCNHLSLSYLPQEI